MYFNEEWTALLVYTFTYGDSPPFPQSLHISRSVYKEFNSYLVAMVAHLWNSRSFSPRSGIEVSEELLHQTKVADYSKSFDLIHHPAFLNYALDFHQQVRKHTTTCWKYNIKCILCILFLQYIIFCHHCRNHNYSLHTECSLTILLTVCLCIECLSVVCPADLNLDLWRT